MDPIERLTAIEEIKQLKARYFRCMDMKDWDGQVTVFAPDVEVDVWPEATHALPSACADAVDARLEAFHARADARAA